MGEISDGQMTTRRDTHMQAVHTEQRYGCKGKATWFNNVSSVSTSLQRLKLSTRNKSYHSFPTELPCVQIAEGSHLSLSRESLRVDFWSLSWLLCKISWVWLARERSTSLGLLPESTAFRRTEFQAHVFHAFCVLPLKIAQEN